VREHYPGARLAEVSEGILGLVALSVAAHRHGKGPVDGAVGPETLKDRVLEGGEIVEVIVSDNGDNRVLYANGVCMEDDLIGASSRNGKDLKGRGRLILEEANLAIQNREGLAIKFLSGTVVQ
jgi:hypothetical protein